MNPLTIPCPKCRAGVGERCKNYLGKNKQTCPERAGRKAPQHQRNADRKNAKAKAEADQINATVPLFAHLEPEHTPKHNAEDEYRHWRMMSAKMQEHLWGRTGSDLLNGLRVVTIIAHTARTLVGDEVFAKLDAYCRRTYPSTGGYWYSFWKKVLTGGRVEFAYERVENRQPGEPATRCTDWYEQRHMTEAEYYARFPYTQNPPPEAPDDGGLGELLRTVCVPNDGENP